MLLSLYADSISAGRAPAAKVLSSAVTTAIDESRRTADALSSAPSDWPGEVAADIATVAASERIRDFWSLGKPGDCPTTAYSNDVFSALVLKASPMLKERSADLISLGQQFCSMKSGGLSDEDAAAQLESAGVTAFDAGVISAAASDYLCPPPPGSATAPESAAAEPSMAPSGTAAAMPSATAPVAAGDAYEITCGDEGVFASLDEAFAARTEDFIDSTECTASLLNPGAFAATPEQAKAIKIYGEPVYSDLSGDAGSYEDILRMCAQGDPDFTTATDAQAMLLVCAESPDIKMITLIADKSWISDDGDYVVGEDIKPGKWKTMESVSDCYWERTSPGGDIIANQMITFAKAGATVTIGRKDGSFTTQGCGGWTRVG